jgi:hypothetical protein
MSRFFAAPRSRSLSLRLALTFGAGLSALLTAQMAIADDAADQGKVGKPPEEIVVTGTGYRVSKEALLSHVGSATGKTGGGPWGCAGLFARYSFLKLRPRCLAPHDPWP